MFKHLLTAAALSLGLSGTSASAALLDITEILTFTSGGFGSSLIHNQSKGRMSGGKVANVDNAVTGGQFNTSTGDIWFDGSVSKHSSSSTYKATGNLQNTGMRADGTDGLMGSITFSFLGDLFNGMSYTFIFEKATYTSGGEPNGFASNGVNDYIALWGDLGNYDKTMCANKPWRCKGIDLRIAYEDNGGGGGVVPLPASLGFLLAGMGGLGVARKLRKKA